MKVYAYPRVSTDEQVEKGGSLFEQQERLSSYCKAMGWEEPIFFVEEGYSAKSLNRPKLTELLEAVKSNPEGGIVLTTKLDRLSRKLLDILNLNSFFNKYNYNFISATEGFDTSTPAGRLVLQMLGMVAEFERERNSERVKENMLSLARNSKKIIARPCFGYDVIDGEQLVNIEESLISRKMIDWTIQGKGPRFIIDQLNNVLHSKTKEGNLWHEKVLREYLLRETLVGDFVYNKTTKVDSKVVNNDESKWIVVKDHHPAIMERHEREKITEIYASRKVAGKHSSNTTYLLSGLVRCGECGSKMNGKTNKNYSKKAGKTNIHYQYLCEGYLKKSICYHHYVVRDDIENLIIEEIRNLATSSQRQIKPEIAKTKTDEVDEALVKSKIAKLDKKMQKQIEAYNEDLITKYDLKAASDRITAERDSLKKMLEGNQVLDDERKINDLRNRAKKHSDDLFSQDRIAVKQLISTFIQSITVNKGTDISIIYQQK